MSVRWKDTYRAHVVKVFEDGLVKFHENHLIGDSRGEAGLIHRVTGFDDQKPLLLDRLRGGSFTREGDHLSRCGGHEQEVGATLEVVKG